MNRFLGLVAALLMAGCQGVGLTGPSARSDMRVASVKPPSDYSSCGNEVEPSIKPRGGVFRIASVPSSGNFAGFFRYAELSINLHVASTFHSCVQNVNNIPIPPGYVADWFGSWDLCGDKCTFSFGTPRNTTIQIESATWIPKVSYYIYVYTSGGGQLIESYEIGEVHQKGKLKDNLKFASPFANGLVWPMNDSITLEIVHAS